MLCRLFERSLLVFFDIIARTFRKPVNEERTISFLVEDDRSISSGLSSSRSPDTLLDYVSPKIRIDRSIDPPSARSRAARWDCALEAKSPLLSNCANGEPRKGRDRAVPDAFRQPSPQSSRGIFRRYVATAPSARGDQRLGRKLLPPAL
jgi:hypothetical protein